MNFYAISQSRRKEKHLRMIKKSGKKFLRILYVLISLLIITVFILFWVSNNYNWKNTDLHFPNDQNTSLDLSGAQKDVYKNSSASNNLTHTGAEKNKPSSFFYENSSVHPFKSEKNHTEELSGNQNSKEIKDSSHNDISNNTTINSSESQGNSAYPPGKSTFNKNAQTSSNIGSMNNNTISMSTTESNPPHDNPFSTLKNTFPTKQGTKSKPDKPQEANMKIFNTSNASNSAIPNLIKENQISFHQDSKLTEANTIPSSTISGAETDKTTKSNDKNNSQSKNEHSFHLRDKNTSNDIHITNNKFKSSDIKELEHTENVFPKELIKNGIHSKFNSSVKGIDTIIHFTDSEIILKDSFGFEIQINYGSETVEENELLETSYYKNISNTRQFFIPEYDLFSPQTMPEFPKMITISNKTDLEYKEQLQIHETCSQNSLLYYNLTKKYKVEDIKREGPHGIFIKEFIEFGFKKSNVSDVLSFFDCLYENSPLPVKYFFLRNFIDVFEYLSEDKCDNLELQNLNKAKIIALDLKIIFDDLTKSLQFLKDINRNTQLFITSSFLNEMNWIQHDLLNLVIDKYHESQINNTPLIIRMFFKMADSSSIYSLKIIDFTKIDRNFNSKNSQSIQRSYGYVISGKRAMLEEIISIDLFRKISSILIRVDYHEKIGWKNLKKIDVSGFDNKKIVWLEDAEYVSEKSYVFMLTENGHISLLFYSS